MISCELPCTHGSLCASPTLTVLGAGLCHILGLFGRQSARAVMLSTSTKGLSVLSAAASATAYGSALPAPAAPAATSSAAWRSRWTACVEACAGLAGRPGLKAVARELFY